MNLRAEDFDAMKYAAFGAALTARPELKPVTANLGFAKRYDYLTPLLNLRPASATLNLALFRCQPMVQPHENTFAVRLLERHECSTQAFIPHDLKAKVLVIVCLGGEKPELETLKAFVLSGGSGITYKPGIWHHPLVVMDQEADFSCLVWEDGSSNDVSVHKLVQPLSITFR